MTEAEHVKFCSLLISVFSIVFIIMVFFFISYSSCDNFFFWEITSPLTVNNVLTFFSQCYQITPFLSGQTLEDDMTGRLSCPLSKTLFI